MYLMLSVAGSLTIFLTRTRGPFWSIRPARILLLAVLGAETVATLVAVYGVFMTPLGWGWGLFVWGYALAWFLVTDRVKLLGYRILDPATGAPVTDIGGARARGPAARDGAQAALSHTDAPGAIARPVDATTDPDDGSHTSATTVPRAP
jgi:H+-transporting ATPase